MKVSKFASHVHMQIFKKGYEWYEFQTFFNSFQVLISTLFWCDFIDGKLGKKYLDGAPWRLSLISNDFLRLIFDFFDIK